MFWFVFFFCKNSYIFWLLLYLFRAVPQSSLRICLLGLSPQYVCQIKHNSQSLGCALFFSVDNFGDCEGKGFCFLKFTLFWFFFSSPNVSYPTCFSYVFLIILSFTDSSFLATPPAVNFLQGSGFIPLLFSVYFQ